jgi:AcrR family transcriptional regulator
MSTRAAMIAVAPSLAARLPLDSLTPADVCRQAGSDEATFIEAFGDVTGYLVAVQQAFMDRLRDRIVAVTAGVPPGLRRIQLATETYLSACLAERQLRTWLLQARMLPTVLAGLRRQNQIYYVIIGTELESLGWPDGAAAARLYMAMINAAGIVEHRLGPQPQTRDALWHFLTHGTPRA